MSTINETFGIITLDIHSKIISELDYEIGFRHTQGDNPTDATVETNNFLDPIFHANFDAQFGDRANPNNPLDPLETSRILQRGRLEPRSPLIITIFDDLHPEPDECLTINIFIINAGGDRVNFTCNENADNPDDFFCDHTICILNDDG